MNPEIIEDPGGEVDQDAMRAWREAVFKKPESADTRGEKLIRAAEKAAAGEK